jgi:hypothetical protein
VDASTSPLVDPFITLTVTTHPRSIALDSIGNLLVPHVLTSTAELDDLILVNTNLYALALLQLEVEAKLTFKVIPVGRYGLPEAMRVLVSLTTRSVYVRAVLEEVEVGEEVRVM